MTWQNVAFVCIVVFFLCIVVRISVPPRCQPTQANALNTLNRNSNAVSGNSNTVSDWVCTRRQIWTKTPTKQSVHDAKPEPTFVSRKTCAHEVHPSEIVVGVFHCMQNEPTRIMSIMETWGNQPDGLTVTVTHSQCCILRTLNHWSSAIASKAI